MEIVCRNDVTEYHGIFKLKMANDITHWPFTIVSLKERFYSSLSVASSSLFKRSAIPKSKAGMSVCRVASTAK